MRCRCYFYFHLKPSLSPKLYLTPCTTVLLNRSWNWGAAWRNQSRTIDSGNLNFKLNSVFTAFLKEDLVLEPGLPPLWTRDTQSVSCILYFRQVNYSVFTVLCLQYWTAREHVYRLGIPQKSMLWGKIYALWLPLAAQLTENTFPTGWGWLIKVFKDLSQCLALSICWFSLC